LLDEVGRGGAWFATAGAAVDWFRWRRAIQLSQEDSSATVRVTGSPGHALHPGGVIRVHRPTPSGTTVHDIVFDGSTSEDVTVHTGGSVSDAGVREVLSA
jgi:hypothetical protein